MGAVILYGLCAVIWAARAVVPYILGEHELSVFLMNLLIAAIWAAAFAVNLRRFRKRKKEGKQGN